MFFASSGLKRHQEKCCSIAIADALPLRHAEGR